MKAIALWIVLLCSACGWAEVQRVKVGPQGVTKRLSPDVLLRVPEGAVRPGVEFNAEDKAAEAEAIGKMLSSDSTRVHGQSSVEIDINPLDVVKGRSIYLDIALRRKREGSVVAFLSTPGGALLPLDPIELEDSLLVSVSSGAFEAAYSAENTMSSSFLGLGRGALATPNYKVIALDLVDQPSKKGARLVAFDNGSVRSAPARVGGKRVALLVHGIKNSITDMQDVARFLEGTKKYDHVLGFDYPYREAIDKNALVLSSLLNAHLKCDRLDVIAHSMGGLVSRYLVCNTEAPRLFGIKKVITLGTPHAGVPRPIYTLAVKKEALIFAVLRETGPGLSQLVSPDPFYAKVGVAAPVKFYCYGGNRYGTYLSPSTLNEATRWAIYGGSKEFDGIVSWVSATATMPPPIQQFRYGVNHHEVNGDKDGTAAQSHLATVLSLWID